MSRVVFARQVKWRKVRGGISAVFTECSRCYALVEGDRARHWHEQYHDDLDALLSGEQEPPGVEDTPGPELELAHPWREAWRQVAACLRLTPPKTPPGHPSDPPTTAGRAEQWAAIDGLIKRTTEA